MLSHVCKHLTSKFSLNVTKNKCIRVKGPIFVFGKSSVSKSLIHVKIHFGFSEASEDKIPLEAHQRNNCSHFYSSFIPTILIQHMELWLLEFPVAWPQHRDSTPYPDAGARGGY